MLTLARLDEAQIRPLYDVQMKRDFPPSELKHLSAILRMVEDGDYEVIGAYEDAALVAYALVYCPKEERVALLDYFAVEPAYRSKGIGTQLLKLLRAHCAPTADVLMIECERPLAAPDEQEARKRIRFYTQAGAQLTNVRIWLFDVEYSILMMPCAQQVPPQDWAGQMLALYRRMLPPKLYEKNVRLIRG